ncbi:MAG: DUF177 domain-containing protein [Candidatus Krumholzibacteria bacterium]|nr:DUF177 domain-containing protein [Candidatus Krumholzibacteria bacterium]
MQIDLGHAGDRESFSFDEGFALTGGGGEDLQCRAAVTAVMTKSGNRFLLEGTIRAAIQAECARCLAPFEHGLETAFSVVLQRGGGAAVPEGIEEADFVLLGEGEEYRYDIFPHVRESILLEMPIRFLCREECAGICPRCGANRNEGPCGCGDGNGDPRWGDLKKLLNKDDER